MSDIINSLTPGKPLSDADKEKLAKANADASAEAQRLAAEHRARDVANAGHERPVIQDVADSVLDKLKSLPPVEEKPQA